ncbi:MAG TPA: POTRA domain-containing protein [Terracidiphilus sp.]|jgi:outer membrane protein insertion porin family|nr:POTRA domain-containing protein [Terracidiphilus sp.]
MPRIPALSLAALALAFTAWPAAGQSFQPKSIRFSGAPEYSDQELLSTADLKPGTVLTYAEMNRYAQKYVDTGMFSSVAFKFDGDNLVFQLAPASDLLPLRLQNLPLRAGKDLDDRLHRQFPLYHGVLPQQGGLTENVRAALEQMLAAQNIQASVAVVPFKDPTLGKVSAVNFAIVSSSVLVGDLRTEGAIVALDPKASAVLAKFPGTPYDGDGTTSQIESALTAYYKDQGYPEPNVHATALPKPIVSARALRIPMRISIVPGVQYRLTGIQLQPGLLVSQADFDRQFYFRAGDPPDGERLRAAWKAIERVYRDRGYVKAKVEPSPNLDATGRSMTYLVGVDQGPPYTMGRLTIDNVTDDLRSSMLAAWKMPAGSVFNESAISGFFNSHGVNPALEQVFSGINFQYTTHPNDDVHTVDVKLTLEKKP